MKMNVKVYISLKKGVLDPQGETIESSLHSLDFHDIDNVKVGKVIEFEMADGPDMEERIEAVCNNFLINPVMEDYRYEVEEAVRS